MESTPLTPQGYQVTEEVYHGSRTIVQRAIRMSDQKPVVLKFLKNSYPSFGELVQFRNQYTITKNLNLPGIVTPLALEKHGNGYILVMADEGYQSLASSWDYPLNLDDFFPIALQLTTILQGLYQNRIIHKDIKPANILIHPNTVIVQLIDFSISSLLPKEMQQVQNPNVLEGTLAYMSPEQTGRMNRGMDYRTDFYSLGVTFYQLLTGRLPFESDDPMELIHCHLAKQPIYLEKLTGVDIPEVLSEIVMKLMAKNPEERYQSGLGLRHDLEKCLGQWKEKGKIAKFNLGKKDLCDRFLIPEKLYGREEEVAQLLEAFERISQSSVVSEQPHSELILVAGFSGIGKTAVVNEVHKPIVKQRGYFIKGKFDQFNRNIPFSALVQAFRNLMGHLLSESDAQLQQWKSKIIEAVGEHGQVIIEVIPELEKIIGKQLSVPELSGSAAQNRFNLFFGKFIQVFTTKEHPLVIFLDDLQWADSASLNLLKLLMSEGERGYLLIIGAYRDNEVFSGHPLMLILDEIAKEEGKINTITLSPLSQENINYLVADTLSCKRDIAKPLTELVYQKTKGNPFFTTQFLLGLYGEDLISFNFDLGYWECDLAEVRQRALTDDVVEFMAGRLQKLPQETQDVLKLAACIGNQFDLQTLAIVSEQSKEDTADSLWKALQEGFILPQSEVYKFYLGDNKQGNQEEISLVVSYKFLHDRVQQAAYSLIPENHKQKVHLKIGRLLSLNSIREDVEISIFEIVNHWNLAIDLIREPSEQKKLAQLNLEAGEKAKSSAAYDSALRYLQIGISFLTKDCWNTQYNLALNLYSLGAESALLCGTYHQMEELIHIVLNNAQDILDTIKVYKVKLQAYIVQNQQQDCLNIGLSVLQKLHISLDTQLPQEVDSIQELIHCPKMDDPYKLAATEILIDIITPAWTLNPEIFQQTIFTLVNLSLNFGNCPATAFGYAWYGTILCETFGNIDSGYQFGKLALQLLDKFDAKELNASVNVLFATHIGHWKEHTRTTLPFHLEGLQKGLETGSLEYAGYGATEYCQYLFLVGESLDIVEKQCQQYLLLIQKLKLKFHFLYLVPWQQGVLNLQGNFKLSPTLLVGEVYDEREHIPQIVDDNQLTLSFVNFFVKGLLCFLFGEYEQAIEYTNIALKNKAGVFGTYFIPTTVYYASLALLASCSNVESFQQKQKLQDVLNNLSILENYAADAPMNHLHKYDLVKAEYSRVLGNKLTAIELYDKAITGAKENEYTQEEALANELAAKFYLDWGKEKVAASYMQEAYYCYARWGAKAKTNDLEKHYPNLLQPIINQEKINLFTNPSSNDEQTFILTTSTTSNSSTLDLATVIKTSQAISSEIHLNKLLCTLMSVIIENSGADKGILISPKLRKLIIEAVVVFPRQGTIHNSSMVCELFELAEPMPYSLVNYVFRNEETLVINDLSTDTKFAGDDYFQIRQPQSILCTPIFHQGKITSILYLENNFTKEAFTRDSIELLNLLCTQAAISLENARLYENLEQKVQERTRELSNTLTELKATQKKLVESEKMAALGSLVAGVAHEINTPIGTSITVASNLAAKTETFAHNIAQGQLKRSILNNYLETAQKSSDLLVQNLHRAGELVHSFKQVAVDQSNLELRTFKVKEYIEGILLSLAPELKISPHKITVSGDANLTLNSYAGSLAQVVTNLVMNSLKHAYPQEKLGQLHWEILSGEQNLKIIYTDDGCGISSENLSKIFEPFFTTKRNEGGTGLGLHIVYNLITHKLGGSIEVDSKIGEGTQFTLTLPYMIA